MEKRRATPKLRYLFNILAVAALISIAPFVRFHKALFPFSQGSRNSDDYGYLEFLQTKASTTGEGGETYSDSPSTNSASGLVANGESSNDATSSSSANHNENPLDNKENDDDTDANQYPLPKTGGVVHYTTTNAGGWNNQREVAMMAWVVAYLTGHTFQHKPYHPASTGVPGSNKGTFSHGDLWDLEHLSHYVHMQNVSHLHSGRSYEKKFGLDDRFETPQHVVEAYSKAKSVSYDIGWTFPQHQMPWLDPYYSNAGKFGELVFRRMVESFTYNQKIQSVADQVVQKMGGPDSYLTIHIRKRRHPAVDCQRLNLTTLMNGDMYSKGGCLEVPWDKILDERLFPQFNNTTKMVYIAHDGTIEGDKFINNPPPGFTFYRAKDFDALKGLLPIVVASVEQVVATHSEYFVAATHSSWSEYVLYKRIYMDKKDAKSNYDIWLRNLDIMHPEGAVANSKERETRRRMGSSANPSHGSKEIVGHPQPAHRGGSSPSGTSGHARRRSRRISGSHFLSGLGLGKSERNPHRRKRIIGKWI